MKIFFKAIIIFSFHKIQFDILLCHTNIYSKQTANSIPDQKFEETKCPPHLCLVTPYFQRFSRRRSVASRIPVESCDSSVFK